MLTDIYARDKSDGHIHRVGDDRHDSLLVRDGAVCYYNLQTGCGEMGADAYGAEGRDG